MVKGLLAEGRRDEVLSVVRQLVARNEELERRLGGKGKANEGVSSQQLQLVLEELQKAEDEERQVADEKLRTASGIDEKVLQQLSRMTPSRCRHTTLTLWLRYRRHRSYAGSRRRKRTGNLSGRRIGPRCGQSPAKILGRSVRSTKARCGEHRCQ